MFLLLRKRFHIGSPLGAEKRGKGMAVSLDMCRKLLSGYPSGEASLAEGMAALCENARHDHGEQWGELSEDDCTVLMEELIRFVGNKRGFLEALVSYSEPWIKQSISGESVGGLSKIWIGIVACLQGEMARIQASNRTEDRDCRKVRQLSGEWVSAIGGFKVIVPFCAATIDAEFDLARPTSALLFRIGSQCREAGICQQMILHRGQRNSACKPMLNAIALGRISVIGADSILERYLHQPSSD